MKLIVSSTRPGTSFGLLWLTRGRTDEPKVGSRAATQLPFSTRCGLDWWLQNAGMRVHVPRPFRMIMSRPEGPYQLTCLPFDDDPWKGWIAVQIAGRRMGWPVQTVHDNGSGPEIGGLTIGTFEIWGDVFWYSLQPHAEPPRIDYFGNRALWRSDVGGNALDAR